jgi:tetratricopeptide (TPR) repeat protein
LSSPDLESELALIERALRPAQFRFLVLQYNHTRALAWLRERLQAAFPDRPWRELDARQEGAAGVLTALQDPPSGFLLVHRVEALLEDAAFTRSLNQRRDALARHPLGLILLLPSGGDYLHRLSRAMPDLWSLRNLVAELILPPDPSLGGQFITHMGTSYSSFTSEAEARAELASLASRIGELAGMPGSRLLLALLLTRQGKLQLQLSEYAAAEATFGQALALARESGDPSLEATALTELGEVLIRCGDYQMALDYLEQSLRIQREIGDKAGEGVTLNNLSGIYRARGD